MNNPVLYIVEGQTEEKFINDFKDENKKESIDKILISGRCVVLNLVNSKSIIQKLDKKQGVVVFIDLDILNEINIQVLIKNIDEIKVLSKEIFIITQSNNFEDELVRSLANINNHHSLYKLFNCKTKNDFKKEFIECNSNSLRSKLSEIDLSIYGNKQSLLLNYYVNSNSKVHFSTLSKFKV